MNDEVAAIPTASTRLTEEEFLVRFALTRDAIARWTAETAGHIRTLGQVEISGSPTATVLHAIRTTRDAASEEISWLAEASSLVSNMSQDTTNGVATAAVELQLIGRELTGLIKRLGGAG